jgi:hypothetical protein
LLLPFVVNVVGTAAVDVVVVAVAVVVVLLW